MRCAFCPDCGTRLYHEPGDEPEICSLKAGSLDDPSDLSPVGHIWVRSKQPWVDLAGLAGDMVFETEPPSFQPLQDRFRTVMESLRSFL